MKAFRLLQGWTGKIYPGTRDIALVDDETYAAYLERGYANPICTRIPEIQRHALCQAAAHLDVAISTKDKELDDLAKHYGVRCTLHKSRGHKEPEKKPEPSTEVKKSEANRLQRTQMAIKTCPALRM